MPLCNDVLKILLPCRPALDPPWMLVTKPVAQHRGLAGGVGARGVTGKITPHHQVASKPYTSQEARVPLCNDVLKILLPCRPALDPPWMLVTKPVAQHRGLAGGVGARGVTGKITPHHQVASEGGLEGGRGVAAQKLAVIPANDFQKLRGQLVERKRHDDVLRNYSRETGHVGKILFLCLVNLRTVRNTHALQCHAGGLVQLSNSMLHRSTTQTSPLLLLTIPSY